jgi:hypothetical protein
VRKVGNRVRLPSPMRIDYRSMALGDPLLSHVRILLILNQSPFLLDPEFSVTIAHHRLRSVEFINEKLCKFPSCVRDVFTAVALLALTEVSILHNSLWVFED